jgi:transcriptional regulator with XRE-family HTH domain
MRTKFRNSEEIRKAFQDLLAFNSYEEEIGHGAHMIMFRFLSEIEILSEEREMTQKELAQKIGTSASYLTQLYRGNKLLNLMTIAKFEKALDITFEIKAKRKPKKESPSNLVVNDQLPKRKKQVRYEMAQEPSTAYSKNKKLK